MNRKQRRAQEKENGAKANGKPQPPSPTEPVDTHDPVELHALGIAAFRAGQLDKAAALIAQAIAADGQVPSFHYNLGIVLKAQGRLQDAAASYQQAIALKPDYADAHNNLGNIWKALGDREKARASFSRALWTKPGNADTHYSLGLLCSEAGEHHEAVRHFQSCLEYDPDDSHGARILLAHLGAGDAPQRTSPAQLQKIYDVRARFWDQESGYFAHGLVAEALREHAGQTGQDILDIGCGTGLVGATVRPWAGRLDGVDLSPAMIEKARAKELYDTLDQADLVCVMSERRDSYDAVLGAATLIHFGDLHALFRAAAVCLRKNGLFVFTLFPDESGDTEFAIAGSDRLAQSGCFRHGAGYVERLAADCGFCVLTLKHVLHEYDQDGNPVPGLLAVLRHE